MSETSGIRWREWSADAFEEARRADKPILLRLSAVWCHWCHVMDDTSDKVPQAIDLLNERYVPIRVDIDRRPDVRDRYNFGGYPTSVFLTPEGEILTGGTYIPPEQFVHLVEHVEKAYREQKGEIRARLAAFHEERAQKERAPSARGSDAESAARLVVAAVETSLLANFDPEHGGFGAQPKFPHPATVELALRLHQDAQRAEHATVARQTLERMHHARVWDAEEKGFFRYSVTSDWGEPHYEKMLETNAGLLSNYALAGAVLGREDLARVAIETRSYLEATLRDPTTGLFFGSQDADEAYYGMRLAERRTRKAPSVDRTCFTDWNAQMVVAYHDAYRATGEPSWLREAQRTLDSLLRLHYRQGAGFLHYSTGSRPDGPGILSDQVHGLRALLSAFELSGDARYLGPARDIAAYANKAMWDEQQGRFFDRAAREDDLGLLRKRNASIVENGVAARALLRLLRHAPNDALGSQVDALIASWAAEAERFGIFASELALACLERTRPALEVTILGPADGTATLVRESARIRHAAVVLRRYEGEAGLAAAKAQGLEGVKPPAAFFCQGTACSRLYRPGEPFAADAARMAASGAPRTSTGAGEPKSRR